MKFFDLVDLQKKHGWKNCHYKSEECSKVFPHLYGIIQNFESYEDLHHLGSECFLYDDWKIISRSYTKPRVTIEFRGVEWSKLFLNINVFDEDGVKCRSEAIVIDCVKDIKTVEDYKNATKEGIRQHFIEDKVSCRLGYRTADVDSAELDYQQTDEELANIVKNLQIYNTRKNKGN